MRRGTMIGQLVEMLSELHAERVVKGENRQLTTPSFRSVSKAVWIAAWRRNQSSVGTCMRLVHGLAELGQCDAYRLF